MRKAYPYLDWVDRKLWPKTEARDDPDFPKIEAVVILGEPLNWEGALQLILDVIQTDGKPNKPLESNTSQIPVLASNMDLQVISDDHLPGLINRLSGWPKLPFPVLVMVLFFSAWKPYTKNLPGIHWNIRHSWASRRSSLISKCSLINIRFVYCIIFYRLSDLCSCQFWALTSMRSKRAKTALKNIL